MKKTSGSVCVLILVLCYFPLAAAQTGTADQPMTVTFYSAIKYKRQAAPVSRNLAANGDTRWSYFSFATQRFNPRAWDLSYGLMYLGADRDWFGLNVTNENRSVIKDLGKRNWSDNFKVSALRPLPVLKEGEQRRVAIDVSGSPGANGLNGADGAPGVSGDNLEALATASGRSGMINRGAVRVGEDAPDIAPALGSVPGWRPRKKKVVDLPVLVKAELGHMYVIHLLDSQSDSYVLVHVDELMSGDKCTISWKRITAPK